MDTNKFVIFCLVLMLSLNLASANVLITGTVYDVNVGDPVSGVDLTIKCNENSLYTTSLGDGAYAVIFGGVDSCDSLEIISDYSSTNITVTVKSESTDDETVSSSSGGSGGVYKMGYFKCGNGVCDSGEKPSTCSRDCVPKSVAPIASNNVTKIISEDQKDEKIISEENNVEEIPENKITGAVVGAYENLKGNWWVVAIILALIFGSVVAKRKLSKK